MSREVLYDKCNICEFVKLISLLNNVLELIITF